MSKYWILFLSLASAYFLTGYVGLLMPAVGTNVTLMWLPTGIAVAFLFRAGYRYWPAVSLGSLLVNLSVGSSLSTSLGIMLGNTLGPLLTTVLLHRLKFHPKMDRPLDIGLLVFAAHVGMLLSASNGVANLVQFDNLSEGYFKAWFCWWTGDSMGVIVAVPILLIAERIERDVVQQRALEFVCWLLLYVLVALGVFVWNRHTFEPAWALAFLPFPLIAWATLRFGILGASLSVLLLSMVAAYGTSIQTGPFYRTEASHQILMLWLYMATTSTLAWLIAALNAAQLRAVFSLRMSEARLRTILELEPECVKIVSPDGRLMELNAAGLSMVEADSMEQVRGAVLEVLIDEEYRDVYRGLHANVLAGGSGHAEFPITSLKGSRRWLETHAVPYRDGDGEIIGLLAVTLDITNRKKAEDTIRRSEERHRGFIENSSTGTYLYEFAPPIPIDLPIEEQVRRLATDGFIAIANDAQARMYGYERGEQLIGLRAIDLYQSLDNEANNSFLCSMVQNGYRIVDAVSEEFDRQGNPVVFSNDCLGTVENGYLVRIWGSQRDITQQHRFEVAIRKLLETTTSNDLSFEEQLQRILELGCSHFRAEKGTVLRLDGEAYQPLQQWTVSAPVSSSSEPIPAQKTVFEAEIRYSSTRSGVLHFESNKPRSVPYSRLDTDLLMLMSDWIGSQLQLRSTMSRQRAILENSPDFVLLLDRENRVEFVNRMAPEVQPLAIIGTPLPELVRPVDKETIEKRLAEVWQGQSLGPFEIQYSFDGSELNDLEGRVTPVLDGTVVMGLVVTFTDVTARNSAELSVQESQVQLERLVGNLPGMAYRCQNDTHWTMIYVSSGCEAVTGYLRDELEQNKLLAYSDLIHSEDRDWLWSKCQLALEARVPCSNIYRIVDKAGKVRWVQERATGVYAKDGTLQFIDGFIQDISEARLAEERVRTSLREKEAMLKEIHHRVKNNLQIVSSLLNLQADKVKDSAVFDGLRDSQNRVRSMALVHETLYSGNLGRIDLSEYLHALCRHLFRSYGVDSSQIGLVLKVSNTSLDLEQAIPLGLIINELVSNSLKYAFPDGESGQVEIEFLKLGEGRLSLVVSDDGVGLSESIDLKQLSSLGLQLVHDLAHQLAGSVKIFRGNGTQFCITFPILDSNQESNS